MRLRRVMCWLGSGTVALALPACGGRSLTDGPSPEVTAGSSGGSTTPAQGDSSTSTGGTDATGSGFMVGLDPQSGPASFDPPPWLATTWDQNKDRAVTGCPQASNADDVLRLAGERDLNLVGAKVVGGAELLATIELFRSGATAPAPSAQVALFQTLSGEVALTFVSIRAESGLQVRYVLVDNGCQVRFIGTYNESSAKDCAGYTGTPLWGIPPLSATARNCAPLAGYYSFRGVPAHDLCFGTPPTFTGVFRYEPLSSDQAYLYFIEIPLQGLAGNAHLLHRRDDFAETGVDPDGCPTDRAQIVLRQAHITIEYMEDCKGNPSGTCRWEMASTKVYGPFN